MKLYRIIYSTLKKKNFKKFHCRKLRWTQDKHTTTPFPFILFVFFSLFYCTDKNTDAIEHHHFTSLLIFICHCFTFEIHHSFPAGLLLHTNRFNDHEHQTTVMWGHILQPTEGTQHLRLINWPHNQLNFKTCQTFMQPNMHLGVVVS